MTSNEATNHPTVLRVLVVQPDGWRGTSGPARLIAKLLTPSDTYSISEIVTNSSGSEIEGSFGVKTPSGSEGVKAVMRRQAVSPVPSLTFRPTNELESFIERVDPEACLVHPGDLYSLRLALHLRHSHGIPLVTHTMDDHYNTWPNAAGKPEWQRRVLTTMLRPTYRRLLAEVYSVAATNFSIPATMADEYSREFGAAFQVLRPPGKLEPSTPVGSEDALRVVYAGSLRTGTNSDSVLSFARSLVDAELHIFTFDDPADELRLPNVTFHNGVPQEELAAALSEFDFGLIALDYDARNADYVRLSWPSKLSDYLALGLTPIYCGPDSESAQEIGRNDLGYTATSPTEPVSLASTLAGLDKRSEAARNYHDLYLASAVSKKMLRESFTNAIAQTV